MKKSLSLQQQEWLLENNNIFPVPEKKSLGKKVSNSPKGRQPYVPIMNQTSEDQDESAYYVMWNLCNGIDVHEDHPLRKYKTSFLQSRSGWQKLAELFGLWALSVHQVHIWFQHKGKEGAIYAVKSHCYDDDHVRCLFMRYMKPGDPNYFGLPDAPSIHDEHPWVAAQRKQSRD